jgi:hypothetical protein
MTPCSRIRSSLALTLSSPSSLAAAPCGTSAEPKPRNPAEARSWRRLEIPVSTDRAPFAPPASERRTNRPASGTAHRAVAFRGRHVQAEANRVPGGAAAARNREPFRQIHRFH